MEPRKLWISGPDALNTMTITRKQAMSETSVLLCCHNCNEIHPSRLYTYLTGNASVVEEYKS